MCVYWEQIPPLGVVDCAASAVVHSISSLVSDVPVSSGWGSCRSRDMSGFSPSKDEEAVAVAELSFWPGFHNTEGLSLPQSKLGQTISSAK